MPPNFWWKKRSFASDNYFLILILKDQKLFVKGTKLFFSSEIWGHFAFTFCRYLKSEYEGIYLLQVLSINIWGKYPQFLRVRTHFPETSVNFITRMGYSLIFSINPNYLSISGYSEQFCCNKLSTLFLLYDWHTSCFPNLTNMSWA